MPESTLGEMTPAEALQMYATLVEQFNPAYPMLLLEIDQELSIIQLELPERHGMPSMIAQAVARYETKPTAALLSAESWVRHYDQETQEETGIDEAVVMNLVRADGSGWLAQAVFVRTKDGVRWGGKEYTSIPPDSTEYIGDVYLAMREAVRP